MPSVEQHECENCHRIFLTRDRNKRFCNLGCESDYLDDVPDKWGKRLCRWCNVAFRPQQHNQVYCCDACRKQSKKS